jgi:hypothetical protein
VIGTVLKAIGDKVIAALATQGLPALADWRVQVGKRYLDDQPSGPRIVLVPRRVSHEGVAVVVTAATYPSQSTDVAYRAWLTQKPLLKRRTEIDVHVFGNANTPDEPTELDTTEAIADTVYWAAREILSAGNVEALEGQWDAEAAPETAPLTHHFVFGMSVATPVLDMPIKALKAFVPPGTTLDQDVRYAGATPEAP